MTDARDPLRLMDEKLVDPALRAALRQVSTAEPNAAEVAALVERLSDALSGSAGGASWFSQLVSQSGGLKLMAVLVAGGAALWGAAQSFPPLESGRETKSVATHAVEPGAAPVIVEPAGTGRESAGAAGNAAAAAGQRQALPAANIPRVEPLSVPSSRASSSPERPFLARRGAAASFATHGARLKTAPATSARAGAAPAPSATRGDEAAQREQEEAPRGGEESELALITRAQSALKLAPRRALDLLDRHDALYPNGHFAEEREVLWIDALSQLHMTAALRSRAQRFLVSYPSSIHCARVRSLLEAAKPAR